MAGKGCTYKVRCTQYLAEEMARYEGGEIVGDGTDPQCPDLFVGTDAEECYTTSLYTIHTTHYNTPNLNRWRSFGCYKIEIL